MLINIDASALEIHCAAWLSRDPILLKELQEGIDLHSANQKAFGLPSRLIAKVLGFRILYGGSEYSFAQDPDFREVSTSKTYWKNAIEAYYNKYKGIAAWHKKIIQEVTLTGKLRVPGTGREYSFKQYPNKFGGMDWPITQIKNFLSRGLEPTSWRLQGSK